MRAVLQRVLNASVSVDGKITGEIGEGLLVFLGIGRDDTEENVLWLVNKINKLRIFADENDKTNLSLADVKGEILVVSQFTLYADCKKNRPGFTHAKNPEEAEKLYEYFLEKLKEIMQTKVEHGIFGADMKVSLCNDGPFTIILDTDK